MKHILYILFCVASLSVNVACTEDKVDDDLKPVVPDFTLVLDDGQELINENEAMNVVDLGDVLYFANQSSGDPSSVKWILSNETISKECVAVDGKAEYTTVIAGVYDLKMVADAQELVYTNYIEVVGGGVPVPEEVILDFEIKMNGTPLVNGADAKYAIVSGYSIDLTDKSEGNPTKMTWTFTCESAGVSETVEVDGIAYGENAKATYTFPKGGLYTIKQEAGGKSLEFTNMFEVAENLLVSLIDVEMELPLESGMWKDMWWNGPLEDKVVASSTAQKHRGEQSLYFNVTTTPTNLNNRAITAGFRKGDNLPIPIPVTAGKRYEIGFWTYVQNIGSQPTKLEVWLRGHGCGIVTFDPSSVEKNVWKYHTVTIPATSSVAASEFHLVADNKAAGQDASFQLYVDDITMVEIVEPFVPVTLAFAATVDGTTVFTNENDAENEVALGEMVTFSNTSTGALENVSWTITGDIVTKSTPSMSIVLTPESDGTAKFRFAYEGVYNITMQADDIEPITYAKYIKVVDAALPPIPPVVIPDGDILSGLGYDYSFENIPTSGNWNDVGKWWGAGYQVVTYESSTEQAYSGTKSTLFGIPSTKQMIMSFRVNSSHVLNISTQPGDKFKVKCKIYVKSIASDITTSLRFSLFKDAGVSGAEDAVGIDWSKGDVNFTSADLNQWRDVEVEIDGRKDDKGEGMELYFIGVNTPGNIPFEFYIDDLSMTKIE